MRKQTDAIRLLEEAAFTPELWPNVLEELGAAHNARIMSLMRETSAGLDLLAPPHAEGARDAYMQEGWIEHDTRSQRGLRYGEEMRFMYDGLLLSPEERNGLFYREFAARFDVPHCVGWRFQYGEENFVWTFMRSAAAGPASEDDKGVLRRLIPTASAAAIVSARGAKLRTAGIVEGLAVTGTAAILLGASGRVLAATPQAEALFCTGFDVRSGRLLISDAQAARTYRSNIDMLARPHENDAPRGFVVATANGRCLALMVRAGGDARDFFADLKAVLILKPLSLAPSHDLGNLKLAFGLTQSEADIAASIAAGQSVDIIAARREVKAATVRHMIKTIMHKTGVRRQAELAALLASLR